MKAHLLQDTALRYFLEVVRCGSVAVASERLHVVPSAISRRIAGLEQAMGTVLFERQPRGMVPTAAGELLAAHVRRAGLDAERTLEEIVALEGLRGGRVRVATTEGFAAGFLPPVIAAFSAGHPQVRFEVEQLPSRAVTQRVLDGDADLGLTFSRAPEKDIRIEHRQPSPVLAVMRPGHPLAARRTLTLGAMAGWPVALPAPDTTLRQLIDIACSRHQLDLQPVLTASSMGLMHDFVRHGDGLSVAGEISVRHALADGRLAAVPLVDSTLALRDAELQTLAGRVLPHAVRAFVELLRERLK